MKKEQITTWLVCDACHRRGNPKCPHHMPRVFGRDIVIRREVKVGDSETSWWIGREYHYCPRCTQELGIRSRAKA